MSIQDSLTLIKTQKEIQVDSSHIEDCSTEDSNKADEDKENPFEFDQKLFPRQHLPSKRKLSNKSN